MQLASVVLQMSMVMVLQPNVLLIAFGYENAWCIHYLPIISQSLAGSCIFKGEKALLRCHSRWDNIQDIQLQILIIQSVQSIHTVGTHSHCS